MPLPRNTTTPPTSFGSNSTYEKNADKAFETAEKREHFLRQLQRARNDMKSNLIWLFATLFSTLVRGGQTPGAYKLQSVQFKCPRGQVYRAEYFPDAVEEADKIVYHNISGRLDDDGFVPSFTEEDILRGRMNPPPFDIPGTARYQRWVDFFARNHLCRRPSFRYPV